MKQWKCQVCGQVFEGDTPPDPCPVCAADASMFVEVATQPPSPTGATTVDGANGRWRCVVCGQVFEGSEPPVPCPVCGAGADAFERLGDQAGRFEKNTDDRFVLVGGGVASLEAAKAIRKRNKSAHITIISGEADAPYNRPSLSDVLCSGLACAEISLVPNEYYYENSIELVRGMWVERVDNGAKHVWLRDGRSLPYTRLLLATGANPFNPIAHEKGDIPVHVLRSYQNALDLAAAARGNRIILVGGGILGLEAAISLRAIGCNITVIEHAPRILPLQTDENVSALLKKKLEALGIVVLCGQSVERTTPSGVVLQGGAQMAADLVLASMGVRSEVAIAKALGLEVNRGILVNEWMKTSEPGIWAAGDCAEFGGRVVAMAGAAASMGTVAGASMAGDESEPYQPFTPATSFSFEDFSLFSVGVVSQNTGETAVYENAKTGCTKRLFFTDGQLTGAEFAGGPNPGAQAVSAVAETMPLARALDLLK